MAVLDFPPNSSDPNKPSDGDKWTDGCNNVWEYNATDNSWTIEAPIANESLIWKRSNTGVIEPFNGNDVLDMGNSSSDIDFNNFPSKPTPTP
jgi:hypothetical protein